jgi:hypothetical protein
LHRQQEEDFREFNLTHVDNLGSKNRRWDLLGMGSEILK